MIKSCPNKKVIQDYSNGNKGLWNAPDIIGIMTFHILIATNVILHLLALHSIIYTFRVMFGKLEAIILFTLLFYLLASKNES